MERFKMYIDGEHVEATSGRYFETYYPYSGSPWAEVPEGSGEDVDKAVAAAQRAFVEGPWPRMTASKRGALLYRLAELLHEAEEEFTHAEIKDNGKAIREVRVQIQSIPHLYRYYAGLADKLHGDTLPVDAKEFFAFTTYEPLGVIAAITPWNSPLRLLALKLAPALAAGNTMVIKPSEFTSTSTLKFMNLVEKAGFPNGVVNVVTGFGKEVGATLAAHPLVRKVSFTGGVEGGIKAYGIAADGLKSAVLELGGKSPNIVFPDADESAAIAVASGIFGSTGQTCVAGSRLLVHRDIHDEFVGRVVERAKSIRMGDPLDEATELAPVATPPQFKKILHYIKIAQDEGAILMCGGKKATGESLDNSYFIEPTVFVGVTPQMTIAQEEVFGPVLSVIPFSDEAEAIQIANDVEFGLAAGVWTQNLARAHRVARQLQAGTVWINTYRRNAPQVPVGGFKSSGIGRESGADVMREYLQVKSIWVNTM